MTINDLEEKAGREMEYEEVSDWSKFKLKCQKHLIRLVSGKTI